MILGYLLPVLLVYVLIPRGCETTEDTTHGLAVTDDTSRHNSEEEMIVENVLNTKVNENKRLTDIKRRHRHEGRRKLTESHDAESGQRKDAKDLGGEITEHVKKSSKDVDTAHYSEHIADAELQSNETTVSPTTHCPKCNDKEVQKQIRIAVVKDHLLGKLGLTSAPKVKGPLPPLPFDFYMGEDFAVNDDREDDDDDDDSPKTVTRQIFVFGEDITEKCFIKKGTGCYSFNISQEFIDPQSVSSIELWVYKQVDRNDHHIQTFMVSELEPFIRDGQELLRIRNIVKRMETRLKSGWMKIYVKRSVIRWLTKPHRNHGLSIVCSTCQRQNHKTIYGDKEGLGPILVFYMKSHKSHRRPRRQTRCVEGGNNCCHKETLEINFRDIGWDYIMAPTSIRPNFCTGSCNGIQAAYYNHTRLMQTIQHQVTNHYTPVQTCCSPVSFRRPQSLLYRDHVGVVRKVDVPDLIVGECGCT